MASGVKVKDEVVQAFNDMKVRKTATPEEIKKRKKAVFFKMDDTNEHIIIDPTREILVGDNVDDVFKKLSVMVDPKLPCYILADISYQAGECSKEDLVFITWIPEDAHIKQKMLYSSSKDGLTKKLPGIKHLWNIVGKDEWLDHHYLANKFVGCTSVEGKRV